jgi:DNA repair ATPase RecN
MDVASVTYSSTNSADVDRVVLLEHPRRTNGWSLDDGLKADETAPNLYRFKVPVAAHATAKLEVREHGPEHQRVDLNANQNQTEYLLDLVKRVPDALDKLKPVIDAQTALAELDHRIAESKKTEETAAADEARDRDNLTALKGNDAARRFVDELNHAEDQLQATRKQTADLEQQKQAAVDKLNALIAGLSFDWDVTTK